MTIKVDRQLTTVAAEKGVKEKLKALKQTRTDSDILRLYNEQCAGDDVFGDVLQCDVCAFNTSWNAADNSTSFAVSMVVWQGYKFTRLSFIFDDEYKIKKELITRFDYERVDN